MNVAGLAVASLHRRLIVVERDSAAFFLRLRRLLVDIELERRDSLDLALADGADYVLLAGTAHEILTAMEGCNLQRRASLVALLNDAAASDVVKLFRAGVRDCFLGDRWDAEAASYFRSLGPVSRPTQVTVDHSSLLVFVDGRPCHFTRTEFKLVTYLLERSGQWIPSAELVTNVLGTHHDSRSSIIRVHMHGIRKALGHHATLLRTDPARSKGYLFEPVLFNQGASA